MKLREIGEFGFIDRIRPGCLVRPAGVIHAIGDDAAVFRTDPGHAMLITMDLLVERIHFLREAASGFHLGHKAMAVNLSDIAAMGGSPREAFAGIAAPEDCSVEYLEDLYRGMKTLAGRFGVNILGGDTTGSRADLVISLTVTGIAPEKEILYRSGAVCGDVIFSTGNLGDSRAGLELVLSGSPCVSEHLQALREAHLLPRPHIEEGRFLAKQTGVHSAIDVSDGLSSDLFHILKESGVGARLVADNLPVSAALGRYCAETGTDPADRVLSGGEDYVLIGTVAPDSAPSVFREYEKRFDRPLHAIGEITDSGKMEIVHPDGGIAVVRPCGWDHFRKKPGSLFPDNRTSGFPSAKG